mmetsp:Transcript_16482/g.53667  ORF Transcript_16482/g.53667 Transcript_16482/m.53667 type:complete len:229 (-) Transcript_16482:1215-1901(-)
MSKVVLERLHFGSRVADLVSVCVGPYRFMVGAAQRVFEPRFRLGEDTSAVGRLRLVSIPLLGGSVRAEAEGRVDGGVDQERPKDPRRLGEDVLESDLPSTRTHEDRGELFRVEAVDGGRDDSRHFGVGVQSFCCSPVLCHKKVRGFPARGLGSRREVAKKSRTLRVEERSEFLAMHRRLLVALHRPRLVEPHRSPSSLRVPFGDVQKTEGLVVVLVVVIGGGTPPGGT